MHNIAVKFDFPLDVMKKSVKEQTGDWIMTAYASTSDYDVDNDVITEKALEKAQPDLLERDTVLFNHDSNRPIGKVLECEYHPEAHALFVKIKISKVESEIWEKIKEGVINKLSICGQVQLAEKKWDENAGRHINFIHSVKLLEVSVVSVPANAKAQTLSHYVAKAIEMFEKGDSTVAVEGQEEQAPEAVVAEKQEDAQVEVVAEVKEPVGEVEAKVEAKSSLESTIEKLTSVVESLVSKGASEKEEIAKSATIKKEAEDHLAAIKDLVESAMGMEMPDGVRGMLERIKEHCLMAYGEEVAPAEAPAQEVMVEQVKSAEQAKEDKQAEPVVEKSEPIDELKAQIAAMLEKEAAREKELTELKGKLSESETIQKSFKEKFDEIEKSHALSKTITDETPAQGGSDDDSAIWDSLPILRNRK